MMTRRPSHAVGYQSSKEAEQRLMRCQETCVQTYKNQKPNSLDTSDVVRDVVNTRLPNNPGSAGLARGVVGVMAMLRQELAQNDSPTPLALTCCTPTPNISAHWHTEGGHRVARTGAEGHVGAGGIALY